MQKYLQGYHGLVKTLVGTVTYYYQDELGSTSHISAGTGALLESYTYDLYGKPRVYNSAGTYQPNAAPQVNDLGNGGSRWMPELGLYDDRNRFMSPDLGRFIQPDPIGFKGDASNLYRYCGNDWANRTDLMGLQDQTTENPEWIRAASNLAFNTRMPMVRAGNVSGPDTNRTKQVETSGGRAQTGRQASGNSILHDKDGKPSSGESIDSQSHAELRLRHRAYDAMVNENPEPKKQHEQYGWGAQNNKNPKDNIIFGPYQGSVKKTGLKRNTSDFSKNDPSPDGYHRTFVLYTHPFHIPYVDSEDMAPFSSLAGKPPVILVTPPGRGSGSTQPNVIEWPNP